MAKSKSTATSKTKSATTKKVKSAAANNGRSTTKRAPAQPQRTVSTEEIGHVAGDIWSHLSQNGGQTLSAIKKSVNAPPDLILAAVGWLAREHKLDFNTSGRTLKIALR